MTLSKLQLIADSDGYGVGIASPVVSSATAGGPARTRLDVLGAPSRVSVQWMLSPAQYDYLMAFYRVVAGRGSLPFLVDLLVDNSAVSEYQAKIVPGTLSLSRQSGLLHVVEAQLEVISRDDDPDYDATLVWLFEEYREDTLNFVNELEVLVNQSLPS